MRRNKGWMILSVVALVFSVLSLSIAYAAMSETLKITGTANMEAATWKIKFSNLNATSTGSATYELPTISDTSLLDYSVTLTKPGDSVTYTFDVENVGTIDAILGTITKTSPVCTGNGVNATQDANIVCSNITYTLQYADGTIVSNNDLLDQGTTKSMKLELAYNSAATQLPVDDVTVNGLDITMIYNQK